MCQRHSRLACVETPFAWEGSSVTHQWRSIRAETLPSCRGVRDGHSRTSPSLRSCIASAGEDRIRRSLACTDRGTTLPAVHAMRLRPDGRGLQAQYLSEPLHLGQPERRGSRSLRLSARRCSVQQNGRSGRCCTPLPLSQTTGYALMCSVFARVIVALLAEAEAPQLKHLWVFTDDQPCTAR